MLRHAACRMARALMPAPSCCAAYLEAIAQAEAKDSEPHSDGNDVLPGVPERNLKGGGEGGRQKPHGNAVRATHRLPLRLEVSLVS